MPPKKKTAASNDLQAALAELRNEKGLGLQIGKFSDFPEMKPVGMSTGNLALDVLTGVGGPPSGRITEFVGPPSSGKTTAAIQAAAQAQRNGHVVAYMDHERSLDPVYCANLGLDVDDEDTFLYAKPETFEDGANAMRTLARSGMLYLGIHDSVAAMVTKHELEAETGAVQVADRAKMMHQYCRQLNPVLSRTGTGIIFINHLTEVIDTSFAGRQAASRGIKKKTSPGGNAIPYYASMRVEFKQIGNITKDIPDPLTGEISKRVQQIKTQATTIKNKVAEPFRTVELRVRHGRGFSQEFSTFSVLLSHGEIKKSGAWFKFPADLRLDDDHAQIQGEDSVIELMQENPDWAKKIEDVATKIVEEVGQSVLAEVDGAGLDENGFTAEEAAAQKEFTGFGGSNAEDLLGENA